MVTGNQSQNPIQSALEMVQGLGKLPAPEKVYFELQRFNNNMERIQPDITKLAKALERVDGSDIRNLAMALQGIKVSEMLLCLNEANSTISKLYDKLWGKK